MLRAAEQWARDKGLPKEFADPAGYLTFVMVTGRDPLEELVNATDGDDSPFKVLLRKVEKAIAEELVPNITEEEAKKLRREHEKWVALEDRLKNRGWVPLKTRLAIAKVLMPFVHHRLATVEVTGGDGGPVKWQEAANKLTFNGAGMRGFMERMARQAAAQMGTTGDSHIIESGSQTGSNEPS